MRICILGKYPPIEGGVSVNNYWTAYGLAECGHDVHVVTNSNEVEPEHRIHLTEDDIWWHQPRFASPGRRVTLHETQPFAPAMGHIPLSNPFVTKLSSVATQVIRAYDCEVLYASYFEPYCVAGFLASTWTGVPLIVNHAGSDLERLMCQPHLATRYRELLTRSAGVVDRTGFSGGCFR